MQAEIDQLRAENEILKRRLAAVNGTALAIPDAPGNFDLRASSPQKWELGAHGLNSSEITRYSRQILLRSFGAEGMQHVQSCVV